jgi:hypothetical protein
MNPPICAIPEPTFPARLADALARRGLAFSLDVAGPEGPWRFHLGRRAILEVAADGRRRWLSLPESEAPGLVALVEEAWGATGA